MLNYKLLMMTIWNVPYRLFSTIKKLRRLSKSLLWVLIINILKFINQVTNKVSRLSLFLITLNALMFYVEFISSYKTCTIAVCRTLRISVCGQCRHSVRAGWASDVLSESAPAERGLPMPSPFQAVIWNWWSIPIARRYGTRVYRQPWNDCIK